MIQEGYMISAAAYGERRNDEEFTVGVLGSKRSSLFLRQLVNIHKIVHEPNHHRGKQSKG